MSDLVEVTILGRKISLKSDGNEEFIREIVEFVNGKIAEVLENSPGLTDTNVAILAGLNIADDYFEALEKHKSTYSKIERRCDELLNFIDSKV